MNVILYTGFIFLLYRAGGLSQISVVCKKKWWKRNWETFAWLKWPVEIWPLPLSHTSKLQVGKITSKNINRAIGCYVELNFLANLFNLPVVERSLTDKNQMKHFILMCNEHRHKQRTVRTTEIVDPTIRFMIHIAGGIIYDSTIHDLDMSLWLAGSQPESVYVSASAFDPDIASCGDYDQVVVTIKFKNGVVSSVENGRVAPYGYDQRLEVCVRAGISEGKTLIYM